MKTYLAIDIGASSGRHIVSWIEKGVLQTREVYRFPNEFSEKDGRLCWDAEGLFAHVVAGLKAACEQGFTPRSIGIDTWAVDYVFLDRQNKMVGDLVAYRDSRTDGADLYLEKAMAFDALYRHTGIAKQPFNTIYQMSAALREHPEYRDLVDDFLLVPEYLSFRLTGKKAHEWTNASTTALCSPTTCTWAKEVLDAAGLPETWFRTPMVQPGTVLGQLLPDIAAAVGFSCGVILPATHDTGSAYMAVPARDEQAVFLSSGTWSLLGKELRAPITTERARAAGFTNEGGYGGTTRFLKNIMGMWMLQCLHKETGAAHSFADMARMAQASSYPAYVNAADQRFLAPSSMMAEVKAALREQGAPEPRDLADVLRAVTMGLAVCYRDAIREMEAITGQRLTSVNIVGGGSQNVVLNQMTADVTGLPVLAGPAEGTALGNLAAQMIADGAFADLAAFRKALTVSFEIKTFLPRSADES